MEQKKNIYQKINEARCLFLAENVQKSGDNKFAKYKYFELSDILPHCIGICSTIGLAPVISFDKDMATMTVYDTESDQKVVITSPMDGANLKGCHEIQNTGARETYSI